MNNYRRNNYFFLALILLITGIFLGGCATMGETLGEAFVEVLDETVSQGTDKTLGKHKGKISSTRILREDQNGYLIEVHYKSVRYPQGVSINAEAYGPSGPLTEYVSTPHPISSRSGQAQLQLNYQGGSWYQSKPVVNQIVVKLYRDENPYKQLASSTINLSKNTASGAGTIIPQTTGSSSSSTATSTNTGSSSSSTATSTKTMAKPYVLRDLRMATIKVPGVVSYTMGNSCSCSTSGSKDSFLTSDGVAFFRVNLQNVKPKDAFRYEWRDPSGNKYAEKSYTNYSTSSNVCHCDQLDIKGKSASSKPGPWTVQFFYKGQLQVTKRFTISKPTKTIQTAPPPRNEARY